jgi:hypothetical protein
LRSGNSFGESVLGFEEHDEWRWVHSYRLWALLCFELWQRTYLDSVSPPETLVADIAEVHAAAPKPPASGQRELAGA